MRPVRELIDDLRPERKLFAVLGVAAVVITLVEYLLIPSSYERLFPHSRSPLGVWTWWSAGQFLLWGLIPYQVARRMGFAPSGLGLGRGSLSRYVKVLAVLYLFMFAALIWASRQDSFQEAYPLVSTRDWRWSVLLQYWFLYAVLFVTTEFLFRGYLLFTLEKRFGYGAIAVMIVPYCMIHFHKPLPEALGAILAGVALGWLALKTRSIWGGVILHVSVALTLDVLVLMSGGLGFPKVW